MKFNTLLDEINIYEANETSELITKKYGVNPKDIIRLSYNENPFGCSPKVSKEIALMTNKISRYSDDSMFELKSKLCKHFNINKNELIIGTGSNQIIEFIMHAKLNPNKKVLMNKITFSMYKIYAKYVGAKIITTNSIAHDLDQFLALYKEHKPDVIFICTPNNPTGDALSKKDIYSFLDHIDNQTLVIIDGAYMEYATFEDKSKSIQPKQLINKYTNCMYLGTFSKAYGLAGMRIGYGIAKNSIIKNLYKIRPPFNITTLSLKAACIALDDNLFVAKSISYNFNQMQRFKTFANDEKLDIIESYTNFVTFVFDKNIKSKLITQALLEKGVIINDVSQFGLNAIRVTIGTALENNIFFKHFKYILNR